MRPEGFEPPISAFGGPRVIQLRYGRTIVSTLLRFLGRDGCRRRHVFEEVELVFYEAAIEFADAVGVTEEIRTGVGQIVAG